MISGIIVYGNPHGRGYIETNLFISLLVIYALTVAYLTFKKQNMFLCAIKTLFAMIIGFTFCGILGFFITFLIGLVTDEISILATQIFTYISCLIFFPFMFMAQLDLSYKKAFVPSFVIALIGSCLYISLKMML